MKDIRSLYLAAKNSGSRNDIDQYREAVTELTKHPLDYLAGLEYIISSSVGLESLQPFINQYGLAIPVYEQVKETVHKCRDKAKALEKDTKAYDEAVAWIDQFGKTNARLIDMYEFFRNEKTNEKQYLETYYGFNPNGVQGRNLPAGMIQHFGEAAIPDVLAIGLEQGGATMKTIADYLVCHPQPMIVYEWTYQSLKDEVPEQYHEYYLGEIEKRTMSHIVENMRARTQEQINESMLLGEPDHMLEYAVEEVMAVKDLISFQEYTVLCESFPTTLDDVLSLYEELDGFLPPDDRTLITDHLYEDAVNGVVDRSYKSGYDYETGHAVKVVYDISPEASPGMMITAIGPAAPYAKQMRLKADFVREFIGGGFLRMSPKDFKQRVKELSPENVYNAETNALTLDKLRKEGYMDFQAEGCRILEIVDRVTGESLTRPVAIFGIFALPPNMPLALPPKALEAWHNGTLTGVGMKEGGFTLNKVSAGEVDSKTFMATHWFPKDSGYAKWTKTRASQFGFVPYDATKDTTIQGNDHLEEVRSKYNGYCADPDTGALVLFDMTCRNLANIAYLGSDGGKSMDELDQRKMAKDYYKKINIRHADGKVRLHKQVLADNNAYMKKQIMGGIGDLGNTVKAALPGGKEKLIAKAMAKMDLKTGGLVKELIQTKDEAARADKIAGIADEALKQNLDTAMQMYHNKDWAGLYNYLYQGQGRAYWESVEEFTEDGVDLVAFVPEETWMHNSMDKKTGAIPAYLRNNHNMDPGGYEQMTGHTRHHKDDEDDDEVDLDAVRRPSVNDDSDMVAAEDEDEVVPSPSTGGVTNYYYYNYNNSLNQNSHSFNRSSTDDHSTHDNHSIHDDHSRDDHSVRDNHSHTTHNQQVVDRYNYDRMHPTPHTPPQTKDDEYWGQVEAGAPWELDDPFQTTVFTEGIFDGKNKATCRLKKLPSRLRDDVEFANERILKNMRWVLENDNNFRLGRKQEDRVMYFIRQMKKRRFFSVVGNAIVRRNNERYYSGEVLVIPEVDPEYWTPTTTNDLVFDTQGNVGVETRSSMERTELSPDLVELINEIMETAFERFKEKNKVDDEFKSLELVGRGGRTGFHWVTFKLKPSYAKRLFDYIKNPKQYPLTEAKNVARPESDHPIKDALMDVDQALVKQHQKNKKAVQDAQNVGRALMKPVERTKGWVGNMVSDIKSKQDTKRKEEITDPAAAKTLAHRAVDLLKIGALAQAHLLFNPVFLILAGLNAADKKGKYTRLRSEIISEIKTAIEILDDQIKKAEEDGNFKAKYEMMRQKNELNNKLIRVSAGKKGYKIV